MLDKHGNAFTIPTYRRLAVAVEVLDEVIHSILVVSFHAAVQREECHPQPWH